MIETIGNEEYNFNVKLGVTVKIKKAFGKSFNDLLRTLDKLDIEDYIKLLYQGLDTDKITLDNFKEVCYENLGMMDLFELVQKFIKKIQYPGLTEEEIDKKLEEKNLKAQAYKNLIG